MTDKQTEALRLALENICAAKLCEFNSMSSRHEMIRLMDAAITAIREALAEQPSQQTAQQEPVAIKWTLDGDKTCGYNNWLGETPFGRILITWKGWKEYHDACVDEFPGDFAAYGLPDEVKAMCEAEFAKRSGYTSPQPAQPIKPLPLTDEQIIEMYNEPRSDAEMLEFARAIEAAHGIKE